MCVSREVQGVPEPYYSPAVAGNRQYILASSVRQRVNNALIRSSVYAVDAAHLICGKLGCSKVLGEMNIVRAYTKVGLSRFEDVSWVTGRQRT